MTFNFNDTERFLTGISQCGEPFFTFQTFLDRKTEESRDQKLVRILHGKLGDHFQTLCDLNQAGAGVFVVVNRTDGTGRRSENILAVRALFVDLDGAPLDPVLSASITPHLVIETSPQRYHAYWIVENVPLDSFEQLQKALSRRFESDPKVCDLPRVMRLPGLYHHKGEPFLTKIIHESGERPVSLDQFRIAFQIEEKLEDAPPNLQSSSNPVLEALQKQGMIIQKQAHPIGCWTIRCPWSHLHSTRDLGTKYYEPNTNGYSGHGFQCFHTHCESKKIQDLLNFLGTSHCGRQVPLPLQRSIPHPEPYPFDCLGEILGPAAKAMYRSIQAPDAICAQSVLAAAALTAQAHADIHIDGRVIPLSSFFLTIGESGDRKTGADKAALKPVYDWQKSLCGSYREEFSRFQANQECWEAQEKEWRNNNKSSPFNLPPPIEPLQPLIMVDEPTYEGIVKYLAIGQPSIGLFSDEGGRFFGGYAMNRDNILKTTAGLSSLWDGKPITRMRAGDGNMVLFGRRFSLHLMVQELILSNLMGNSLVEVQGFLPRCLISFPASMAGKRSYREEDLSNDPAMQRFWDALNLLLDRKLPVNEPPAPQNELHPRPLCLVPESKKLWITYHNQIDIELADGKKYHPIRRFASKAAEHALRLAGALTLMHDPTENCILPLFIERSCCLLEYYLRERLRIQSYVAIDPALARADRFLAWCRAKEKTLVGLSEIYQYGPPDIRQAKTARFIMGILVSHGQAIPMSDIEIDGKTHKEAWQILPKTEE